jgi:hypothetical protein
VTGVQTCALPIYSIIFALELFLIDPSGDRSINPLDLYQSEIDLKTNTIINVSFEGMPEFTKSPRLLPQKYNNSSKIYERRKRLFIELESNDSNFINKINKKQKLSVNRK